MDHLDIVLADAIIGSATIQAVGDVTMKCNDGQWLSIKFGHGAAAVAVGKANTMQCGVNVVKDGQDVTLELGDAVVRCKEKCGYWDVEYWWTDGSHAHLGSGMRVRPQQTLLRPNQQIRG